MRAMYWVFLVAASCSKKEDAPKPAVVINSAEQMQTLYEETFQHGHTVPVPQRIATFLAKAPPPTKVEGDTRLWYLRTSTTGACDEISLTGSGTFTQSKIVDVTRANAACGPMLDQ